MARRYYPAGIQTFSEIITKGFVYIDKTDLMWRMQEGRKYVFFSRPRRFGKSVLSSTFHSFFAAEKHLFEGLKVMELEKEWTEYPVIHIDLSTAKYADTAEELRERLIAKLYPYIEQFGVEPYEKRPGEIFSGLIQRACKQTGRQTVVIIDEYDAPLLDALHEDETLAQKRRVMQEFYIPLKACDPYLRFCFITGITKFSQLSIFSAINNLSNLTLWHGAAAICGITEEELTTQMGQDIAMLAEANNCTPEEMHRRLKFYYDGYHFCEGSPEVYNPFSLMKAFDMQRVKPYWFDSGTPTYLIHQMQRFHTDITTMENLEMAESDFDRPTEAMTDALPLLYQAGYLTINGYEPETGQYLLSIPNQEVRIGFADGLTPAYTGLESNNVRSGFALKFWRALKKNDINLAMQEMQSYMAGIPYVEGFKKKLAEAANAEGFYEYTMYLIFSMLNLYARTQVKCAKGRIDMIVLMPDTTYVFEMKVNGTAEEALRQIETHGYALPFHTPDRRVVRVGVKFNPDTRVPESWVVGD